MTRTLTLPLDDRSMWRCLVSRSHPDAGGSHELFIWAVATRDAICGGELGEEMPRRERREQPSRRRDISTSSSTGERVPFEEDAFIEVLTARAIAMAGRSLNPMAFCLGRLQTAIPPSTAPCTTSSAAEPLTVALPPSVTMLA
jgi:hypothetical protein